MYTSDPETSHPSSAGLADVAARPLIDIFLERRSRRFAMGSDLHGGAMDFTSAVKPVPLSVDEEAILAFAGSGVTGRVYGELPYQPLEGPETGGGQIMMSMVGRTQSSADAVATVTLFILRDDGTYVHATAAGPHPANMRPSSGWAANDASPRCTEASRITLADHRH